MARARNLKPGLYKNEDLAECSVWARYIFPGMWTLADRDGRLEDRPKRIKAELLAFDSVEVEPLLQELAARGFIRRYSVDGVAIIQVVTFAKHQNPHHREAPSELPAEPGAEPTCQPEQAQGQPGAEPPKQEQQAQGQPEASPGHDTPTGDLAGGSSRASSLIPSSLIPSSLIPDPSSGPDGPAQADAFADGLDAQGSPLKAEETEDAQLFREGLALLGNEARTLIGRWKRDHGASAVLQAILEAKAQKPNLPVPWIAAALKKTAGTPRTFAAQRYTESM